MSKHYLDLSDVGMRFATTPNGPTAKRKKPAPLK